MTINGWIQIGVFLAVLLAITKPLGVFMAKVFRRERTFLDPVVRPIERLLYRVTGVDEEHEMRWTEYAFAMLLFSGATMLLLYLIERVQQFLPLNPQKFGAVAQALAFNTAASCTKKNRVQKKGTDAKPVVDQDGKPVMDTVTDQTIAQGPVASQEAIKMLGTNGGGFFNANSSHPFENPTPLSNLLQMLSIFAIPAGLTYTLGRMTGSQRHGWAVWAAMAILFLCGV